MTIVYTDASSAILLFKADLFQQTAEAFSLIMAETVFQELTLDGYSGGEIFKTMAASGKIEVVGLEPAHLPHIETFPGLHKGERETLSLQAQSGEEGFVLIDDGQGAKFCAKYRIPFINALLVPKIFWYSGLMNRETARDKMNLIAGIGRYSHTIIKRAQILSKTDLAYFIQEAVK